MANLLDQASVMVDKARHEHASRTVTYARGVNSVVLQATVGRTEAEQADEFGLYHRVESRDFLIRTGDLVLAAAVVLPEAGDKIRESDGATDFVYEVMAFGGEPPFRYSDPQRRVLRVHTKHVLTEPTP